MIVFGKELVFVTLADNRKFYRRVLATALPMMAQNAISTFVSLLDNLMVGQLSTAQIGGVTIINNNLLFIFYLCLFGVTAGAGIFTTQFYGSGDNEGIRYAVRFKLLTSLVTTVLGVTLFLVAGKHLIGIYLQAEDAPQLAQETLFYAEKYLRIMLWGLLPFGITTAYAGTLKVCGHPTVALIASIGATVVNIFGNWVFIFGNLGCPALGIEGAAIATVIARYVEMLIVMLWCHLNTQKVPFIKGLYKSLHIPGRLLKNITAKAAILLLNESMWAIGIASLNQCYSIWSQEVNAALGISATLFNMASISFKAFGSTVGIITGQMLGADTPEKELRSANTKMTLLCAAFGIVFAAAMASASSFFPRLYQTTDTVRALASGFILIAALDVVLQSYIYPVYFTLRAGGKTFATFLFDCGAIWLLSLPLAFVLSRFTQLHIFVIYGIVTSVGFIKSLVGVFMIRSGNWIQKLTIK